MFDPKLANVWKVHALLSGTTTVKLIEAVMTEKFGTTVDPGMQAKADQVEFDIKNDPVPVIPTYSFSREYDSTPSGSKGAE